MARAVLAGAVAAALLASVAPPSGPAGADNHDTTTLVPDVTPVVPTVTVLTLPGDTAFPEDVELHADVDFVPDLGPVHPPGEVAFFVGTDLLDRVEVDGNGEADLVVEGDEFPVSATPQTVTAEFVPMPPTGDPLVGGSSDSAPHLHDLAETSVELESSDASSVYRQSVTFTATVTIDDDSHDVSVGTVTFLDDGTALATRNVSAAGVATHTVFDLAIGTHTITATYSGADNYKPSQTPEGSELEQTVSQGTPAVALSAPATSTVGQNVTLTATVSANAGEPAPTGSVTFADGSTELGTVNLTAGQSQFQTSTLSVGSHVVTATYGGDESYVAGSHSRTVVVNKSATTLTLTPPSEPAQAGTLRFVADVAASSAGAPVPTGSVTFQRGSTALGTAALDVNGRAVLDAPLTLGRHTITATYAGGTDHLGSSASRTLSVTTARPATRPSLGTAFSFTDATRDIADCRADLNGHGATYSTGITLAAGIECGTDPATDPIWDSTRLTGVVWGVDVDNDLRDVEYYVVVTEYKASTLVAGVILADTLTLVCTATPSWNGAHVYRATFARSCIGTPAGFRVITAAAVDRNGGGPLGCDCVEDIAPETGWSPLVSPQTQSSGGGGGGAVPPPPKVGVRVKDASVREPDKGRVRMKFVVRLLDPSTQTVKVRWRTANGTARARKDYRADSGTLTFRPGVVKKTVTVVVLGDRRKERTETFFLRLLTPVNAKIVDAKAVGRIRNDD